MKRPCSSRIRSVPQIWAQTLCGGSMPRHWGAEIDRIENQRGIDELVAEDFLVVVDVVDEAVERADALLEPAPGRFPFPPGDDPRNQVERPFPIDVLAVAVDGEGDAHGLDGKPRRELLLVERPLVKRGEIAGQPRRDRPGHSRPRDHLIVKGAGIVGLPVNLQRISPSISLCEA